MIARGAVILMPALVLLLFALSAAFDFSRRVF